LYIYKYIYVIFYYLLFVATNAHKNNGGPKRQNVQLYKYKFKFIRNKCRHFVQQNAQNQTINPQIYPQMYAFVLQIINHKNARHAHKNTELCWETRRNVNILKTITCRQCGQPHDRHLFSASRYEPGTSRCERPSTFEKLMVGETSVS